MGTCLLAAVSSLAAQVQTGPITEPRGQEERAAPVAKGAAAITQRDEKCLRRLIVNADALFKPHRWTLNPDASETLDVLGPMIVKAGAHPARIETYTSAADSQPENRDVAERRAITVRTWLVNHRFLAEGTPTKGMAGGDKTPSTSKSRARAARQKNGTVEAIIETKPCG